MTQKQTTHSVDYIRAIKEYLKLRTITDDLTQGQQVHLSYLAFLVKANGTAAIGYKELQRLRLAPKTIAKNNRRFKELGLISKVDIGHTNQFGKGGKVSKFYFDMGTILRLNTESADFPIGEDSKNRVLTSQGGSADFSQASADFPQGSELLPYKGSHPEVLCPKQTLPEEICPESRSDKNEFLFEPVEKTVVKSVEDSVETVPVPVGPAQGSSPDTRKRNRLEASDGSIVHQCLWCEGVGPDTDFVPIQGGHRHSCPNPPKFATGWRLVRMVNGKAIPIVITKAVTTL